MPPTLAAPPVASSVTVAPATVTDIPRHVLTPCTDPSLLAPDHVPPLLLHARIPTIDYAALMAQFRAMQGEYVSLRMLRGLTCPDHSNLSVPKS